MSTTTEIDLKLLTTPFSCKWRVQSVNEYAALCVPYIDSRAVQNILDEVCGAHNWQSRHKDVGGSLYCEIGIRIEGEWIWKSDVGSESNIEKEKGAASDSFKRAAVQWGVGRFLYDKDPIKLKTAKHTNNKYYPIIPERKNEIIFNALTLNNYCDWIDQGKPTK